VKEFNFQYNYNQLVSRLVEITERAWNGDELNSTIVEWGEETAPFELVQVNIGSTGNKIVTVGDYNGNGCDDIILTPDKVEYEAGDKWELFINNNHGQTFSKVAEGDLTSYLRVRKKDPEYFGKSWVLPSSDYNGDGLSDHLLYKKSICMPPYDGECDTMDQFFFQKSTGNGFYIPRMDSLCGMNYLDATGLKVVHGDFDGDGRINCEPFAFVDDPNRPYFSSHLYYNFEFYPVDFNGDGITDLIGINQNNNFNIEDACIIFDGRTEHPDYNPTPRITENTRKFVHTGFPTKWHRVFPGDFNGDGKADFLTYSSTYGWQLTYSDDNGHYLPHIDINFLKNQDPEYEHYSSPFNYHVYVLDVNGDGLSDIIELQNNCNSNFSNCWATVKVSYGNGNNGFTSISSDFNFMFAFKNSIFFGDFNGDGRLECFLTEKRHEDYYYADPTIIRIHSYNKSHLVKSITNGLNLKCEITYKPLTDATVYTKGENAPFPAVRDLQGPIYVASSVEHDNGIGGTSTLRYLYKRGSFSFNWEGIPGVSGNADK
jgi:hypothetical protein